MTQIASNVGPLSVWLVLSLSIYAGSLKAASVPGALILQSGGAHCPAVRDCCHWGPSLPRGSVLDLHQCLGGQSPHEQHSPKFPSRTMHLNETINLIHFTWQWFQCCGPSVYIHPESAYATYLASESLGSLYSLLANHFISMLFFFLHRDQQSLF